MQTLWNLNILSVFLLVKFTRRQITDEYIYVGEVVGDCGILRNYFRTLCEMHNDVGDYGISHNYFRTLYEMPTDIITSVSSSMMVAFHVIISELSVRCQRA